MLQSGDWLVPTLAGEPFMDKPPLFYWTAALFAKLFSPLLPLHDGARHLRGKPVPPLSEAPHHVTQLEEAWQRD
jgi:hypothetical protein